jgi:hypothetical protein
MTMRPSELDAKWREAIRRLDAAYSVGGREALEKMSGPEVYVLYSEKLAELRTAGEQVRRFPHDELAQLRKEKAERETADMREFLKENQQRFFGWARGRSRDMELER